MRLVARPDARLFVPSGVLHDRDDIAMFGRAVQYKLGGYGNGAFSNDINAAGECQESGRDHSHTQMELGHPAGSAEIAWKQGIDLYSAR